MIIEQRFKIYAYVRYFEHDISDAPFNKLSKIWWLLVVFCMKGHHLTLKLKSRIHMYTYQRYMDNEWQECMDDYYR